MDTDPQILAHYAAADEAARLRVGRGRLEFRRLQQMLRDAYPRHRPSAVRQKATVSAGDGGRDQRAGGGRTQYGDREQQQVTRRRSVVGDGRGPERRHSAEAIWKSREPPRAHTASSRTAMPCPTPMHMIAIARRARRSASSSAAVSASRAPLIPSG